MLFVISKKNKRYRCCVYAHKMRYFNAIKAIPCALTVLLNCFVWPCYGFSYFTYTHFASISYTSKYNTVAIRRSIYPMRDTQQHKPAHFPHSNETFSTSIYFPYLFLSVEAQCCCFVWFISCLLCVAEVFSNVFGGVPPSSGCLLTCCC